MKITGQILKENREKKGISVNEVAMATKINAKAILAMESGDADKLPPRTFLRGFVRAYASYLQLDVEQMLSTYQEEMGTTKLSGEGAAARAADERAARRDDGNAFNGKGSSTAKTGAVIGILILIALIILFKKKMDSYESETVAVSGSPVTADTVSALPPPPATPIPEPASGSVAALPSLSPSVSEPLDKPKSVEAKTSAPTAAAATPAPSPPKQPTPVPVPAPTAVPELTATPTPKPKPSSTPAPKPTPRLIPVGTPVEVLIEALDAVTIDAQVDSEAPTKFKMTGQQVQTIKAKKKVVLRFSDGGAVNLVVNGVDRSVPGDLGKPLRVVLP